MNSASGLNFNQGTLADATPFPVLASNITAPATIALNSTAGGRLIEYSVDGGINYQPAVLDVTSTPQIILIVKAPISHVRFTGQAGDKWFIR